MIIKNQLIDISLALLPGLDLVFLLFCSAFIYISAALVPGILLNLNDLRAYYLPKSIGSFSIAASFWLDTMS